MNLLGHRIYRTGDVEVDVSQRVIRGSAGTQSPRAKTFDLLVYLIEHRHRVVPRDELLSHLWPGASVTTNSLTQCVNEARKLLNDDPREPRFIRTVSKTGYQFIGPVDPIAGFIEEITTVQMEYEEEPLPLPPPQRRLRLLPTALVLSLVAACSFAVWRLAAPPDPAAGAILILPFENSSTTADLDWLRQGLPDMLITNLSRSPGIPVLGREQLRSVLASGASAPAFDRALAWARQHRASSIITGSFASLGGKVRIAAHIYRTSDGSLQHSESFVADRPEQILTHIDLASLNLAAALGHPIGQQDRLAGLSSLMTSNIEAYRYYSLGLEKANALLPEEAIEFFRKAVQLDPNFAMAHARIGYTYTSSWGLPEQAKPSLETAFRLSNRLTPADRLHIAAWYALANLDYPAAIKAYRALIVNNPRDVEAYTRLGSLLSGERRVTEAVNTLEQALVIDPNSAPTWNSLSGAQTRAGLGEAAVLSARRYVALSPEEANSWDSLGLALHVAGRLPEAEQAYLRALALKPSFGIADIHLANLFYHQGRFSDAAIRCRQFLAKAQSPREQARGHACLANIYLRQKRPTEAAQAADSALQADSLAYFTPALIALSHGDRRRAEQLAQTPWNRNDRGKRAQGRNRLVLLGRIAMHAGQTSQALDLFRKAVEETAPVYDLEWYEDCLADALLQLGRLDEAVAEYNRALTKFPSLAIARYHLAQAYSRLGKHDLAQTELQRFRAAWNQADLNPPEMQASARQP